MASGDGSHLSGGFRYPTVWASSRLLNSTGVSRFKVGDRVAPIFYPKWLEGRVAPGKMAHLLGGAAADGVLADFAVLDEASLVHVPAHLTDEEAATLPCAGVTAWSALLSLGSISPGDSVVVLGTGGVSVFALQFAG